MIITLSNIALDYIAARPLPQPRIIERLTKISHADATRDVWKSIARELNELDESAMVGAKLRTYRRAGQKIERELLARTSAR